MTITADIAQKYRQHIMPTYAYSGLVLTRGKGARVWDADGKVYLDFQTGIAVVGLGHCHPEVTRAVQEQAARLVHVSNLHYNENQALLAEKLAGLFSGGKCFFCNSGAEANEAMIKLARLRGQGQGRFEIISLTQSFHGRTLAALAATGQTKYQTGFEPMPEGFRHATFNDLESVRAAVTDKTSAILVEAVQGEGGVVPGQQDFLRGLRALCDERDLLLLCDEVQCGMGRTGRWFGFEHADIRPDAFSLAKALGNGYPIGAVVAGPRAADVFQPGKHASTFGGSPLACAAALAVLRVIEAEGLVARAAEIGARFQERLRSMVGRYEHVREVRGLGLMVGLVLDQPARPLTDRLAEMGLLAIPTAESVIRFLPPLTVKDGELDEALDIIEDAVAEHHGAPREEATP